MARDRSSLVRGGVVGALVAVGVLLLWVMVTGGLALVTALQVQNQTQALTEQLRAGDSAAAQQSLTELQDSSGALAARLNSAPWTQVATLPLVGPTVTVLAGIAQGTGAVMAATEGQEAVITDTVAELKARGTSGAGALKALQPVTAAAAAAVAGPAQDVGAVSDDEIFAPLRSFTVSRQQQFLGIAQGVQAAEGATVALPALLGAEGPRTWLVVVQNDAEPRGTGGLLSAYSVVDVRNGDLRPRDADTTNDLFDQPPVSLAGIPADTRRLWGPGQLGRWWGFNLDRHFPYAGLLMHRGSPVPVDDVITLDARVVAGLLAVTGPVKAKGVRVDAGNAARFFTVDIYDRFRDPERKDAVTVALIKTVMSRLADGDLDPLELWDALALTASQGRLLTYSADPRVQEGLAKMPTSGEVPDVAGPWASAAINDFAGNKLGAYLTVTSRYESAAFCADDATASTVSVNVTNEAPTGLPPYADVRTDQPGGPTGTGSTRAGIAIYGPVGAMLQSATLDGAPLEVRAGSDRSRPVWQTDVELPRGAGAQLAVQFSEPRVPRQPVVFSPQPMVQDMTVDTTSLC